MFDFVDYYTKIAENLPYEGNIAEVGVADGASIIYLAEKLESLHKLFKIRLIDNLNYGNQKQLKTIMDNVIGSGLQKRMDLIPLDSLNASLEFPDNYFDFIYLDSGHTYELTKAEIRLWIRKVKDGGILAGHDYHGHEEVKRAVDEVVPPDWLKSYETAKGYGVWEIRKTPETVIR